MSFAKNVPIFANVSHQTRLDTRSKARRPIKVEINGRGGRERAETRTLLVYVAHRLTWCNVSLVSRSLSKGVNNADRPPGGSLVETRSLKASSLPLFLLQSHAPDRNLEQAPGCSSPRTCRRKWKKSC